MEDSLEQAAVVEQQRRHPGPSLPAHLYYSYGRIKLAVCFFVFLMCRGDMWWLRGYLVNGFSHRL